jgi:hypothetical protein
MFSALGLLSAENWTVLVYMAADNNLASYAKQDINSMESVAIPSGSNVIVQADFPEGATRYRIGQDNSPNITSHVIADLGEIDSGSAATLNSFIRWGFAAYPSQRKMLVIWSHGDSWYKQESPIPGSKWICPDDGSQHLMSIAEGDMQIAFAGTPKLDVLLFDACSMQGIEVLGEVYPYADYVIGSEELVPVYGFPYEAIIPLLGGDFEQLLIQIPELYRESYLPWGEINTGEDYWTTTCSTIKTASMPQFLADFKNFVWQYREFAPQIMQHRPNLYDMNTGEADVDVNQFLFCVANYDVSNPTAFLLWDLWQEMVIKSTYTTPHFEVISDGIGSAALWFPDIRYNFNNGWERYSQLEFAKTRWLSLINHALGEDTSLPACPVLITQNQVLSNLVLNCAARPDPDSLYYELVTSDDDGEHNQLSYPDPDAREFTISVSVVSAGSYKLYAIDQSGNRSLPLTGSFAYSEPACLSIVFPNPVKGTQLANLSWWADASCTGNVKLDIYNLRGQKVLSQDLGAVVPGQGDYLLSADSRFRRLAAGRYFISLQIGNVKLSNKISILY